MREFTLERTCRKAKPDGTDSFVTCEIVTDNCSAYAILTNMGPCFTLGEREPTAGKHAMINRTISFFARTEADKASAKSDFQTHIEKPDVAARIADFRLFTSIVSFCKLAMHKCPWLQPDLAYAKQVWKQGDRMLKEEYQMPVPEPRRLSRRAENCRTQAIMESVARVYMYKQVRSPPPIHSEIPMTVLTQPPLFSSRRPQ